MNINEAITQIKRVGSNNARVSPTGEPGKYQVEIRDQGSWVVIECTKGMTQSMAQDLIGQAVNRVILG